MSIIIKTGDSVASLKELNANVFDMVITSPPYDKLRIYDGHSWDFEGTAKELFRCLKPGGVLCWNVNDSTEESGSESVTSSKQKVFFKEACGFMIHDTMIYERLNFSHPERVRYHQMFEYVFVMAKGSPKTWNPIKDKKNATAGAIGSVGQNTFTKQDGSKGERDRKVVQEFGMRGNVWRGKTRGQEDMCEKLPHPAMMPKWLVRDLMLSWSNAGDLVADPFAGSGTVGLVAVENARSVWLNDVDGNNKAIMERYCFNTSPGLALL